MDRVYKIATNSDSNGLNIDSNRKIEIDSKGDKIPTKSVIENDSGDNVIDSNDSNRNGSLWSIGLHADRLH